VLRAAAGSGWLCAVTAAQNSKAAMQGMQAGLRDTLVSSAGTQTRLWQALWLCRWNQAQGKQVSVTMLNARGTGVHMTELWRGGQGCSAFYTHGRRVLTQPPGSGTNRWRGETGVTAAKRQQQARTRVGPTQKHLSTIILTGYCNRMQHSCQNHNRQPLPPDTHSTMPSAPMGDNSRQNP
jgi:hypothetical protein